MSERYYGYNISWHEGYVIITFRGKQGDLFTVDMDVVDVDNFERDFKIASKNAKKLTKKGRNGF